MNKTNVCRCCLSIGCIKDLSENYTYIDKLENYGEMLNKTFNLTLDLIKLYICERCITRLRDATTFKQQILEVDDTFAKLITNKSDSHETLEGKTELIEEPPGSEDYASDGSKNVSNHKKLKSKKNQCTSNVKKKSSPEKESLKHQRKNSINLISHSNICLFKSLRTRFACYVCNEKFFNIKELRNHSKIHSTEDFKRRINRLRGKSYENADISNLKCNICSEKCVNLDILRNHLTEHGVIFGDATHILIPYKLEEGFRCDVCLDTFNTFTRLSIHMNCHATSNVCETCGLAFYNRISLRNHIRSIHRDHKCSICSLCFPTSTKLVRHKQRNHGLPPAKHHCLRCNLTFRYQYLLKKHSVEKHDAVYTTVECSLCDKVFKDGNCLKTHFRSVHLNERNFPCSLCDLRFFTRTDRARHERTHDGGSLYACNLCETKFKSKDSVRRHLKRQHVNSIQVSK